MTLRTRVHLILFPTIMAISAAFFCIPNLPYYTAMAIFFIVVAYSIGWIYTFIAEAIIEHFEHK